MRIAQQLLISDKNTFEQLTPTEKKLWTTFETADIYRFLTGEEDTVPEFQYNWTTVPKLQPLDPVNAPITPANTAPTEAPPAPAPPPTSPPSPQAVHTRHQHHPLQIPGQRQHHLQKFSNHSLTLQELPPPVPLHRPKRRNHKTWDNGPRSITRTSIPVRRNSDEPNSGKDVPGPAPPWGNPWQRSEKCLWQNYSHQFHETLRPHLRLPQNDLGMSCPGVRTRGNKGSHKDNLPTWLKLHPMFQHPFRTPICFQNSSWASTPQHGNEHYPYLRSTTTTYISTKIS